MRIGILCLSPRDFVNVSSVSLGTRARTCYVTVLVTRGIVVSMY